MKEIDKITEDKRRIKAIYFSGEDNYYAVAVGAASKIEAYDELGQGTYVPWFAVYEGDFLKIRVNGAKVESVEYFKD